MNFTEFKSHLLDIDSDKSKAWIYRGQANPHWSLETTYSRFYKKNPSSQNCQFSLDLFYTLLTRFIRRISEIFGSDYESYPLVRQMSLGQHYGLPTPLLDWTHSPFIAVYFAVTDDVFHDQISTKFDVYALDTSCFNEDILHRDAEGRLNSRTSSPLEFIDTNRYFSRRIANQMGCFTYQEFESGLDVWLNNHGEYASELRRFQVEGGKSEIIRELELMGIKGSSLFDDLAYVARDVINEELNRKPIA